MPCTHVTFTAKAARYNFVTFLSLTVFFIVLYNLWQESWQAWWNAFHWRNCGSTLSHKTLLLLSLQSCRGSGMRMQDPGTPEAQGQPASAWSVLWSRHEALTPREGCVRSQWQNCQSEVVEHYGQWIIDSYCTLWTINYWGDILTGD